MNPFDFVNAINQKNNLLEGNPDLASEYNPFIINRAFSYYPDTIFHANRMNMCPHLSAEMQWDYYFYATSKKRRFSKWSKVESSDLIQAIMWIYQYSENRARETAKLLDPGDVKKILAEYKHRQG
jgi:hypothetical protein